MPRIVIRTLQDHMDGGYTLTACCETWRPDVTPCMHSAELDIAALIDRLGADFDDFDRLRAVLTCSKCGGKGVSIRLSPRQPKSYATTLWTGGALDWKG